MCKFKKLDAWILSKNIAILTYKLTTKFPTVEKYSLVPQMRRAAISVPSNIAEGNSRFSNKEYAHFIEIAYGSLMELICQYDIALELKFINKNDYDNIMLKINQLSPQLSGLRRYLLKNKN